MPLARALVCGASGFLGRAVTRALEAQGSEVVGIGRRAQALAGQAGYRQLDLNDMRALGQLLTDFSPSHVVYLAAPSSVEVSFQDPERDLRDHVGPWSTMLSSLRHMQRPPRLLLVSSAAVYGEPMWLPVSEDAAISPVSPYGYHKAIQEDMLREYASLFGLPAGIARVFSVYGPGQRKLAVWEMAQRAMRGDYSVRGTGVETRDYLFVEDAALAVYCLLLNAPCAGEAINVASGESWTMRAMAEALYLELELGGSPAFDGQTSQGTPLHWRADVSRLRALGFEPQIGIREGLRRTAHWIRQNA